MSACETESATPVQVTIRQSMPRQRGFLLSEWLRWNRRMLIVAPSAERCAGTEAAPSRAGGRIDNTYGINEREDDGGATLFFFGA